MAKAYMHYIISVGYIHVGTSFDMKDILLVKPSSNSQHLTHNTYISHTTHTYPK